jgi:nucleoside-diphosphate-sugar epimerase
VVINLATHVPSTAGSLLPGAWHENDRIRRVASALLADAARAGGVRRFIQESFAPIYADRGDDWVDETSPVQPARYNRTVLDAEASAQRFAGGGGAAVMLRFASFYGPDSSQLPAMISFVRRGWMPLPGPASSYFSSVSHDDAAAAVIAALEVPPGIYNVGDDEPLRHREVADALAHAVGAPRPRLPPAWLTPLAGSIGRLYARSVRLSNRKLRLEGGWAPRYRSVREGFEAAARGMARGAPFGGAELQFR